MPEVIPDHVPSPRTLLAWDGTAYRPVSIDAAGRLQVRGEDQVFSYKENLATIKSAAVSGADGFLETTPVPAGEIHNVLTIAVDNRDSATTVVQCHLRTGGNDHTCWTDRTGFAANVRFTKDIDLWLDPTDTLRIYLTGSLVADRIRIWLTGKIMTLET